MRESSYLAVAALALCVLAAGCAGLGPGGDTGSEVTAEEIVTEIESVDSYSMEVTRTLQSADVNETVELSGEVDRTAREARIERRTASNFGGEERVVQYVVDGVEYVDRESGWESAPLADRDWSDIDRLETAATALDGAELERIRTEEVAGTETVLYELDVSVETQDELVGANTSSHVPTVVEEFLFYVSVDPETGTLYKTDLRALVTQGEGTARFTVETVFTDHNEPVEVSLPDGAPSDG